MNSTAQKLNKRIFQSTQSKHLILRGEKIKDYNFEPATGARRSTVIPADVLKKIEKLDNKILKGVKKLSNQETAANATATLDTNDVEIFNKAFETAATFERTLEQKGLSHERYIKEQNAPQPPSPIVLGWFSQFRSTRLKARQVRLGLVD